MHEELYGGWSRERFTGADIAEVESLLADNPTERHNLEYKAADWRSNHQLAAQVTSLANSAGGILVWGVKEKPAPPCVDPLHDAVDKQRLTDILSSSVSPPLDFQHLEVQPVPAPSGGAVYVLYVPHSARAPHMVTSKGDHYGKYHRRGVEGCVVMLDYEVRDVMGRRQRPDLQLRLVSVVRAPVSSQLTAGGRFVLCNSGTAVAEQVAIAVDVAVRDRLWVGPSAHSDYSAGWLRVPTESGNRLQVRYVDGPVFPHLPVALFCTHTMAAQHFPSGASDRVSFHFQTSTYCEATGAKQQRFECSVPRSPANWREDGMISVRELLEGEFDAASELFASDGAPPR